MVCILKFAFIVVYGNLVKRRQQRHTRHCAVYKFVPPPPSPTQLNLLSTYLANCKRMLGSVHAKIR